MEYVQRLDRVTAFQLNGLADVQEIAERARATKFTFNADACSLVLSYSSRPDTHMAAGDFLVITDKMRGTFVVQSSKEFYDKYEPLPPQLAINCNPDLRAVVNLADALKRVGRGSFQPVHVQHSIHLPTKS